MPKNLFVTDVTQSCSHGYFILTVWQKSALVYFCYLCFSVRSQHIITCKPMEIIKLMLCNPKTFCHSLFYDSMGVKTRPIWVENAIRTGSV